jgi:hypothetical protein
VSWMVSVCVMRSGLSGGTASTITGRPEASLCPRGEDYSS